MLFSLTALPLLAARLAPRTLFLALSPALVPMGALTLRAPRHRRPASRSSPVVIWRKVSFHTSSGLAMRLLGHDRHGILTWIPTFLSQALGASARQQALVMALMVTGFTLGAPAVGRPSDRLGDRATVWLGHRWP